MKLRWSNGRDYATEFEANDPDTFYRECLIAMRMHRIVRSRRVHRGEIHKTVTWFESAVLHVGVIDDSGLRWYGTGRIEHLNSPGSTLDGAGFFEPIPVELRWAEADSIESMHERDQAWFDAEHDRIWQMCLDSCGWSDALNVTIMQVGDAIDRHLENEQDNGNG